MSEARMKLGRDTENDVLCAWRVEPIEDVAYSEWKMIGGFGELQKKDM